jgi:hypothetical protein
MDPPRSDPASSRGGDGLERGANAEQLLAWGAAHGGGDVFRPSLLTDPTVAMVVTYEGERVAAGAIGHRSTSMVGVSNLFTTTAALSHVWAGATAAISARLPGMPLVGYEDGASLLAALHAGFVTVGPLRVWLKD